MKDILGNSGVLKRRSMHPQSGSVSRTLIALCCLVSLATCSLLHSKDSPFSGFSHRTSHKPKQSEGLFSWLNYQPKPRKLLLQPVKKQIDFLDKQLASLNDNPDKEENSDKKLVQSGKTAKQAKNNGNVEDAAVLNQKLISQITQHLTQAPNTKTEISHDATTKNIQSVKDRDLGLIGVNNADPEDPMDSNEPIEVDMSHELKTVQNQCNAIILNNYKMRGRDRPALANHKFCPNITYNCCTEEDQDRSMEYWNSSLRMGVQQHYSAYLNSIRYLFGFYPEANRLAKRIYQRYGDTVNPINPVSETPGNEQLQANRQCFLAAEKLINFQFDKDLVTVIINGFVRLTNMMIELRSGFFCTICDGQSQEILKKFWQEGNTQVKDTLFFSQSFCKQFAAESADGAYYYIFYLYHYLEDLKTLIDCELNDQGRRMKPDYTDLKLTPIPETDQNNIKNCFYKRDKALITACEGFCNSFNLAKPHPVIEGDIVTLKKYVEFVNLRAQNAFSTEQNALFKNPEDIVEIIYENVTKASVMYVFFQSDHQTHLLDSMGSDTLVYGGINPFHSGESNMYHTVLASVNRLLVGALSAFYFLILN